MARGAESGARDPGPAGGTRLAQELPQGAGHHSVLQQVDLAVRDGEFLAIVGKSGSGKSTLLHLLATLDAPDDGEIHFDGRRIDNLSASRRDRWRNRQFGIIFQFYHLLPELTTLENVLLPAMIASPLVAGWSAAPGPSRSAPSNCWNWSGWATA